MKKNITLFFLALTILLTACKKANKDELSAEYYFKGSLNGTAFNWEETEETQWRVGTSSSSSVLYGEGIGSLTASIEKEQSHPSLERKPSLGVTFQTFTIVESNVSPAVFNSFVNAGTWAYSATAGGSPNTKNLVVEYMDEQGKSYNSIGSQTGSTVNIIAVTPMAAIYGSKESLKIKMSLNCKLYAVDGNGAPLTMSNAEAVLYIENLFNHN